MKALTEVKNTAATPASSWAPLREPLFRSLWLAAVTSYIGTWMQNLGAGWQMAVLTRCPLWVSLVQVAMSLPVFLAVLPAGALADMVDRRRLLLVTQLWMALAAAALGGLSLLGLVTPWMLLLFTFLLGLGAVMNDPAWQAITPEIISPEQHGGAVALNSAGYNMARAIGPAIGGFIIAAAGSGAVFLLNAVSFAGVIFVLYRWKRIPEHPPAREGFWRAIRSGILYVRTSRPAKAVLVRTAAFSISASALLALLPMIARRYGSAGFGLSLGCFGLGALAGAVVLPGIRRRIPIDALVALSTLLFAGATFASGRACGLLCLCAVLFAAGVAWIGILTCLNMAAQTMCPAWVRARGLSMYILVLQGGVAAGSAVWGTLARNYGIPLAMALAALGLVAGLVTLPAYPLIYRPLMDRPVGVRGARPSR